MTEQWTPLREWEPELEARVVDKRGDTEDPRVGVVVRCDGYGHFADPYWRAAVLWDSGVLERDINTVWLTREDGTQ